MSKFIELPFGGVKRKFRLAIGELRELQDVCKAGPATILARLMSFQPQAEFLRRPRPTDFELGEADPDYQSALNLFALVRQIGGDWRVDEVREVIRLGLIGGGMPQAEAYFHLMKVVDEGGDWKPHIAAAAQVLWHALNGDEEEPSKKDEAGKMTETATGG